MKLNKLVIAMGLASVVLSGCNRSADDADFSITAIDGYIVNGHVTSTCFGTEYTADTNETGVAALVTYGAAITDCTSKITGGADTYDYDLGTGTSWDHTLSTLPGLAVINPYTDVAATILESNPGLTVAETMQQVVTVLNIPTELVAAGVDLFADFGANNKDNSGLDEVSRAKIAVLAESTFKSVVAVKEKLPAGATAAQVKAAYVKVLPQVTAQVKAKVAEVGEANLAKLVFVASVTLPEKIEFAADGSLATVLDNLPVVITTQKKPDPVGTVTVTATGTGTGTDGVNQG